MSVIDSKFDELYPTAREEEMAERIREREDAEREDRLDYCEDPDCGECPPAAIAGVQSYCPRRFR